MAVAISVGTLISNHLAFKYFGFGKDTVIDMAPYLIIFGILGARLYYCAMDYDFYLRFPTEILALRHGGISIHGAILGGFLGLVIYSKRHKLPLKKLCDVTSIGLAIGQSIGRWGNFFNSEAYGTPTDLPFKLYIAPQYRHVPYQDYAYYHPAFLYESILDFIIFLILVYCIASNKKLRDGNIALIYLILYSLARIVVENCRIDSVRYIYGIPVAILVSICIIIISVILYKRNNR